ncbi:MAG: B12-binding domain-containing protein [Candidatus Heimdallarchaeota archaeon]|nr:B12-binding domain-containing protein [Candidatus Heimdallarchaeota archaeon]
MYEYKQSTISNAIKELKLKDLIEVEKRSLKHGRYAVLRLRGDTIIKRYSHEDERSIPEDENQEDHPSEILNTDSIDIPDLLENFKSLEYDHSKLIEYILNLNLSAVQIVNEIIVPILYLVGTKWELNELSTAEEHLISHRVERVVSELISEKNADNDKLIVLAPIDGEQHTISLLIIEFMLSDKYNVINLRRHLPNEDLLEFIKGLKIRPEWVFYSLTLPIYEGTLYRNIEQLRAEFKNSIKVAIGGQGVPSLDLQKFSNVDKICTNHDDVNEFISFLSN